MKLDQLQMEFHFDIDAYQFEHFVELEFFDLCRKVDCACCLISRCLLYLNFTFKAHTYTRIHTPMNTMSTRCRTCLNGFLSCFLCLLCKQ